MRKSMKKKFLNFLGVLAGIFLVVSIGYLIYYHFSYKASIIYNSMFHNNLQSMESIIKSGTDINKYNYSFTESTNVLDEVYFEGTPEMTKLLIDGGVNINEKLVAGENALYLATFMDDIQLCEMVINRGADINHIDEDGYTVFDYAIMYCSDELVNYYIDNWFKLNSNNITSSLLREHNDSGELTSIDNFKRTQNLIKICNEENIDTGLEPIIEKAYLGKSDEVIKLCTDKNLDKLTKSDKHLLSYVCAAFCNVDTLKKLDKEDISITHFNTYYIDTLRCATAYNSDKVIEYLIDKCKTEVKRHKTKDIEKVNDVEVEDYTPLDYAVKNNNKKIMDKLLDMDCTPNNITYMYYSDVHNKNIQEYLANRIKKLETDEIEAIMDSCIEKNNVAALETLINTLDVAKLKELTVCSYTVIKPSKEIKNLLDDNSITIDYENMLLEAIEAHNFYMVKYIVKNLDSLDYGSDETTNPIAVAISSGDMEIFDYLVASGASLDISDEINMSIISLARESNYSWSVRKHIYKSCINQNGLISIFLM